MARPGRGGGGKELPFEVDTALEDQIEAYRNTLAEEDDDWTKTLYPPMNVHGAPPPTDYEKVLVNKWREHRTAMRSGPFFIDAPKSNKRDPAHFNAFEDVDSYSNKRAKKNHRLPNLKKVPIVKDFLPRELWDVVSDGEDGEDGEKTTKNLNFLKKKRFDKLAQFDESADLDNAADAKDEDEVENENENEDGEEGGIAEPSDNDFSEDDDDLGNDYNAEKYFDDGDGMDDDGGEDGGAEGDW